MKIVLILFAVIAFLLLGAQFYFTYSQKDIERYPYSLKQAYKDFEVRSYEASLFSSVQLDNETYKEGSSSGFRILAGYIFGGNENSESIAMTSPVSMSIEKNSTMMFMVPKEYNKENLPKPNNANIQFVEVPAKDMAVVTFGGWANDKMIEKYKTQLIAALDREGIAYSNRFYFFGYNPPFEIFGRKNEVVVELKKHY